MLGRYWLYVITAGLGALWIATASANDNPRVRLNDTILECRPPHGCFVVETYVVERQGPSNITIKSYAQTTKDHEAPHTNPGELELAVPPVKSEKESGGGKKKTEDLESEQPWWRNPFALFAALNTVFSLVLTGATIGLYRVTNRQARAAESANAITKQLARATLTVLRGEICVRPSNGHYWPAIRLTIRNGGAMTARGVLTSSSAVLHTMINGQMTEVWPNNDDIFHETYVNDIPPGTEDTFEIRMSALAFEPTIYDQWASGKFAIMIWSFVRYSDAFGELHDPAVGTFVRFSDPGEPLEDFIEGEGAPLDRRAHDHLEQLRRANQQ